MLLSDFFSLSTVPGRVSDSLSVLENSACMNGGGAPNAQHKAWVIEVHTPLGLDSLLLLRRILVLIRTHPVLHNTFRVLKTSNWDYLRCLYAIMAFPQGQVKMAQEALTGGDSFLSFLFEEEDGEF